MSGSALIDFLGQRLLTANYSRVATPFSVATVQFNFDAAFVGNPPRSSDLVIVIDTSVSEGPAKIGERTRQRLQALARALDVTGSNLVVTAILAGASLPPDEVDAIAKICRVLAVTENPELAPAADKVAAQSDFEDRIRSLLPLTDTKLEDALADPIARALDFIKDETVKKLYQSISSPSNSTERAVTAQFVSALNAELTKGLGK